MIAWAYIAILAFVAHKWRSKAAIVGLPALIGTVALTMADAPHQWAYTSCFWTLSGLYLLRNSEFVAGVLYGISGMVYIAFYFGAVHATFAFIPVVSDIALGLGLIAGTWPNAFTNAFRVYGGVFRGGGMAQPQENMAGMVVPDRHKG